jgi:hypothetical protein
MAPIVHILKRSYDLAHVRREWLDEWSRALGKLSRISNKVWEKLEDMTEQQERWLNRLVSGVHICQPPGSHMIEPTHDTAG